MSQRVAFFRLGLFKAGRKIQTAGVLMKMRLLTFFAVAALALGMTGAAHAEANLSETKGQVLVNAGAGFVAHAGQALKAGDRIMLGPNASARVTFADGCSLPVNAGIITIPQVSPCKSKAQFGGGLRNLLANPLVIAGVVATAIAIPVALHNARLNRFSSP